MKESTPCGMLNLSKPAGFTSFDAVAKLRRLFGTRRIGHGGTLDPMATGVLPIFVGGATRAVDFVQAKEKEYVAGFTLGITSDTQDRTGTVLTQVPVHCTGAQVQAVLPQFTGEIWQVPPMYSAIQMEGKRLYDLARQGIEVERKARPITVHALTLEQFDEQTGQGVLRATVSKGTYIRTLIHDIGQALGTGAVMHSLERTRVGTLTIADAVDLETLMQAAEQGTVLQYVTPVDTIFATYPRVDLDDYGFARAKSGAFILAEHAQGMPLCKEALCRVYYENRFLMLGKVDELNRGGLALFVYKNFV